MLHAKFVDCDNDCSIALIHSQVWLEKDYSFMFNRGLISGIIYKEFLPRLGLL